jgi:hypothetical protein
MLARVVRCLFFRATLTEVKCFLPLKLWGFSISTSLDGIEFPRELKCNSFFSFYFVHNFFVFFLFFAFSFIEVKLLLLLLFFDCTFLCLATWGAERVNGGLASDWAQEPKSPK